MRLSPLSRVRCTIPSLGVPDYNDHNDAEPAREPEKIVHRRISSAMRSPLDYAQRALEYLETSFIPYRSLWWNFWTPPMGAADRYQDGYFAGYGEPEDGMPWIDIRRAVGNPFMRKIYKTLPYVDVRPVVRPWDVMSEDERSLRELFTSGATKAVYSHGKALYPRDTIQSIEDQLSAYEKARRPVPKLLERCEAPQTAFVHYRDFDGVVQHQGTWKPGAVMDMGSSVTVL